MSSVATLALALVHTLSPGQFEPELQVLPAGVMVRPTIEDVAPRGGLFVAYVSFDETKRVDEANYTPDDARDSIDLELFPSCVRSNGSCIYRSRFPLGEPEGSEFNLAAYSFDQSVSGIEYIGIPLRGPDERPPSGLDSTLINVDQAEPTLTRPEWLYFIDVFAPELEDDTSIALLEVFDTTEGDRDLVGHVVPGPEWEIESLRVYAQIDVPESSTRCYRLVATDLGGNEAESDDLCFDIVLNEPAYGACSHVEVGNGSLTLGWATLGLVAGLLVRRRRGDR